MENILNHELQRKLTILKEQLEEKQKRKNKNNYLINKKVNNLIIIKILKIFNNQTLLLFLEESNTQTFKKLGEKQEQF